MAFVDYEDDSDNEFNQDEAIEIVMAKMALDKFVKP